MAITLATGFNLGAVRLESEPPTPFTTDFFFYSFCQTCPSRLASSPSTGSAKRTRARYARALEVVLGVLAADVMQFIWPGFSQNFRILQWCVERTRGHAKAIESPLGWVPRYKDIAWKAS